MANNVEARVVVPRVPPPVPAFNRRILEETKVRQAPAVAGGKPIVWHDLYLNDYKPLGNPVVSTGNYIKLGQCALKMMIEGPSRGLSDALLILALGIRDPESGNQILQDDDFGPDVPTEGKIYDKARPESIQALFDTHFAGRDSVVHGGSSQISFPLEVQEGDMQEEGSDSEDEAKRKVASGVHPADTDPQDQSDTSSEHDMGASLEEFFREVNLWSEAEQASFYTFLAAVLCRTGVKARETFFKHWRTIKDRFQTFYSIPEMDVNLPLPRKEVFNALNTAFAPGNNNIRTVLAPYLRHRYLKNNSASVNGILDYTLLLHTSYNGLQLIPLTVAASKIMGLSDLQSVLRNFEAAATGESIALVYTFLDTYAEGAPFYPGHFAAWCRIFDQNFWSNISIKANPTLGTMLMAICESKNPTIFEMMSFERNELLVKKCRRMARAYEAERSRTLLTAGARAGSLLQRFSRIMLEDPDEVEEASEEDEEEGAVGGDAKYPDI